MVLERSWRRERRKVKKQKGNEGRKGEEVPKRQELEGQAMLKRKREHREKERNHGEEGWDGKDQVVD